MIDRLESLRFRHYEGSFPEPMDWTPPTKAHCNQCGAWLGRWEIEIDGGVYAVTTCRKCDRQAVLRVC